MIVAARNEASNIDACLRALLAQDYPPGRLQIITVDDRSEDRTFEIMTNLRKLSEGRIAVEKIDFVPENFSPKKFALSRGIEMSTGEIIFTTDADCIPPREWVSETVPLFSGDVGMVIGPAPFEPSPTFLEKLLALDNLATAFVAAGAAGWNIGVTCSGRNLAYRRSVYDEVGGFKTIQHSLSGDDDLFLQQVGKLTRWRIRYSLNAKTTVPSRAAQSPREFVTQRRRHVSAGKYYSKPLQVAYALFNLANLTLFAALVGSIFAPSLVWVAAACFVIKLIFDFLALFFVTRRFGKANLLSIFPAWEFFFLINMIAISPLGFIGKLKWK